MRNNVETSVSLSHWFFFLVGVILLLLLVALVANGQSEVRRLRTDKAHARLPKARYREARGSRLGMTAVEVRAKLGEPAMKSDEQDYYVISATETVQIAYNAAQKVVTISTDYAGGVGAPDYKNVVGDGLLLERPDGSLFRMARYDSEHFWVSYNKSAATVPDVTITIGAFK